MSKESKEEFVDDRKNLMEIGIESCMAVEDYEDNSLSTENDEKKYDLPYTLNLKFPIKLNSSTISELVFTSRIRSESITHLPINQTDIKLGHFLPIIAKMTNSPLSIIGKLDYTDMKECIEVVSYFLLH